MLGIIRRIVLPALLLVGGLASLIYARFHVIPVLSEEKTQTTIEIPMAMPRGSAAAGVHAVRPAAAVSQASRGETSIGRNQSDSEPSITREVSIGGVALDESGEIKRTYSGKAPSLCPT